MQGAADNNIEGGEYHQHNAGHNTCSKHLAYGYTRNQGIQDHQDTWRNQNAPAATGIDNPECHLLVVTPGEHGGECDRTHSDHCRTADAHHGCKYRTNTQSTDGQAAPEAAEPEIHHAVQVSRNTCAFENHRHEYKQWYGHQCKAFHGAPDLGNHHVEGVKAPGEIKKNNRHTTQHECQWQAKQQEKQQRTKE